MKEKKFVKKIYTQKIVSKTQKKIKYLGSSYKMDPITFLNLKLFTSIIFFFVVLYIFDLGFIFAPLITFIYFYLFELLLLDYKIKRRIVRLESESIHFFEVLTLSIETGRNLEEGLNITIKSVDSDLSREFKEALREVKFGKSLTESLKAMSDRIPSESINNIILTLTQADVFGTSIITTLYTQVNYLRDKRNMEIKAQISKMPIKISIISVLFFIPLVLLIILGPIILNYIS